MLRRAVLLGLLGAALVPAFAHAAVSLVKVGTFSFPVYVAAPPGDTHRLLVVEQGGRIQLMVDGQKQATPFLDISGRVTSLAGSGEQGLLSMAFAPDYATSGKFYVYYTSRNCPDSPGCDEHVSQFTRSASNPNVADPSSEHVLLTIPHPTDTNHNGGQLQFGPDGYLYISTGDGGGSDDVHHNAQKTSSLLGKLLRIDPANPAASVPGNFPGTQIYARGLRNPWRFSFDRLTGDMIIGDVGQGAREEIDFAHPGQNAQANYGWPCFEGTQTNSVASGYPECMPSPPPEVPPVHDYGHSGSGFTGEGIIGGYVVRDPSMPDLYGRYLYGDLQSSGTNGLRSLALTQPTATDDRSVPVNVPNLSSFGEDAAGCVYAASTSGGVWRVAPAGSTSPGPCPAAAVPPPSGGGKDTTPAVLKITRSRKQHVLRTRYVRITVSSNELATIKGRATVSIPGAARVFKLGSATRRCPAGKRVTLKVKVPRKTLAKIRRSLRPRKSLLAKFTVTSKDAAGNASKPRHTSVRLVR